jgi:hypothetical protein
MKPLSRAVLVATAFIATLTVIAVALNYYFLTNLDPHIFVKIISLANDQSSNAKSFRGATLSSIQMLQSMLVIAKGAFWLAIGIGVFSTLLLFAIYQELKKRESGKRS